MVLIGVSSSTEVRPGDGALEEAQEDCASSLLVEPTPRHRTAFANSRTIRFVPGTCRLVPTTNRTSAPLLPLPFDVPMRSFPTTSPTPSPSLCASLYNTTLGLNFPIP